MYGCIMKSISVIAINLLQIITKLEITHKNNVLNITKSVIQYPPAKYMSISVTPLTLITLKDSKSRMQFSIMILKLVVTANFY